MRGTMSCPERFQESHRIAAGFPSSGGVAPKAWARPRAWRPAEGRRHSALTSHALAVWLSYDGTVMTSQANAQFKFEHHSLGDGHEILTGVLPDDLRIDSEEFEELWNLHPIDRPWISIHGRPVQIPRWQQAYGRDYVFSGQTSLALAVPRLLQPLLRWSGDSIAPGLNGILVNWYDGKLGHYIGPHRDRYKELVPGAPMVIFSFGEQRTLRFRPHRGKGVTDVLANDHGVVIPFETNKVWKHEVPKTKKAQGLRVSVTARAFNDTLSSA